MATKAAKGRKSSAPVASVTWAQAAAWRMAQHHLVERAPAAALLAVAGGICGAQAQVLSSAELALWARAEGLPPDAVARALWEERTLVKTWAMRGTLHLLPAAEYPLWQAALSTYRHYLTGAWFRYFGVSADDVEQLLAAIGVALDGRQLTRDELAAEVVRITGSEKFGEKLRESWGALLKPAAYRGLLCFAPNAGQNVRFTRPDHWLPVWHEVAPEQALSEVARRFLAAYGPATRDDFGRWWATPAANAEKLIKGLGDEVAAVEVEGAPAWLLAAHVEELRRAEPPGVVRLLPAFDPYVLGASRHLSRLLPGPFESRVSRAQGWISPVLLVNGCIAGVWQHEQKGKRVRVSIEPFTPQPDWVTSAAEAEAERLSAFLGGTLELAWAG